MIKLNKGFSLIELLVVMAVISILLSVSIFATQGGFNTSRDTRRRSDLKQYQAALAKMAGEHGGYVLERPNAVYLVTLCTYFGFESGICPNDPLHPDYQQYGYVTNEDTENSGYIADTWIIYARLEAKNGSYTYNYWVVCSNGKSGQYGTDAAYYGKVDNNVVCPI